MNKYEFLDCVCAKIKYKSAHKDICREINEHIGEIKEELIQSGCDSEKAEQVALSRMGNAETIGKEFNKLYKLPFNCRFGLAVWAGLVTVIFYLAYPILHKMLNYMLGVKNVSLAVVISLLLFTLANIVFLRRGRLKLSLRDACDISVGFLIGAAAAVGTLFAVSSFYKFGYYPYFDNVKILFFNSVSFYREPLRIPGNEFLIWLYCIVVYAESVKTRKKIKRFSFVYPCDFSGTHIVDVDEKFYNGEKR